MHGALKNVNRSQYMLFSSSYARSPFSINLFEFTIRYRQKLTFFALTGKVAVAVDALQIRIQVAVMRTLLALVNV